MQGPITGEMSLAEVMECCPEAGQILLDAGMGCVSCSIAGVETLADGAALHDLNLEELIEKLNACTDRAAQTEETKE